MFCVSGRTRTSIRHCIRMLLDHSATDTYVCLEGLEPPTNSISGNHSASELETHMRPVQDLHLCIEDLQSTVLLLHQRAISIFFGIQEIVNLAAEGEGIEPPKPEPNCFQDSLLSQFGFLPCVREQDSRIHLLDPCLFSTSFRLGRERRFWPRPSSPLVPTFTLFCLMSPRN